MPSNEKPDRDVEQLADVAEPAPLARIAEPSPEEKVNAELASEARITAEQLKERLNLWIANRLRLCNKETKMLAALRQQVDDASQQKSADAVARYLAQAVHIRSEILGLRNEPNDLVVTGAREGARWERPDGEAGNKP